MLLKVMVLTRVRDKDDKREFMNTVTRADRCLVTGIKQGSTSEYLV